MFLGQLMREKVMTKETALYTGNVDAIETIVAKATELISVQLAIPKQLVLKTLI